MTDATAYALGLRDKDGRLDFVRRDVFPGNMMKTSDPHYAWTWPTVAELELWVDQLPGHAKEQLADRTLLIVPFVLLHGEPRRTITLTAKPAEASATKPAPAPEATKRKPVAPSRPELTLFS